MDLMKTHWHKYLGRMIYGGIFMVDLVKGGWDGIVIKRSLSLSLSLFKDTCMHEYFIEMEVVMWTQGTPS
jgi:hypothetical protein